MRRQIASVAVLISVLAGCAGSSDSDLAEHSVAEFHRLFELGSFSQVYDNSADDLKNSITKADFVALLESLHRDLGDVRSTAKLSGTLDALAAGTFITMVYATQFSKGKANERFVFRIRDRMAAVAGYYVDLNSLVVPSDNGSSSTI
jgi:Protein of unknown function (DUF4019)